MVFFVWHRVVITTRLLFSLAISRCRTVMFFSLSGRVRIVQRHFSRFGFPCFTIPDFVILSNKTVPQVGVPELAFRVLLFQIWCSGIPCSAVPCSTVPGFTTCSKILSFGSLVCVYLILNLKNWHELRHYLALIKFILHINCIKICILLLCGIYC